MKNIFWFLALVCISFHASAADLETLNPRFSEAERLYAEGSYKRAYEAFLKLAEAAITVEEKRWVQYRLAETRLRSESSTRQPDDSVLREARVNLEKYVEGNQVADRIWAEAHEALGDSSWQIARWNWADAWSHYEQALGYWAGSTNLPVAAERYWKILHKASQPARVEPFYYYGYHGNIIPLRTLENALKVARTEEERARAHFMIAMTLRSSGGEWEQRFRIPHEFEASLKLKKETGWYDDALYFYGEWMSQQGAGVQDEQGNWTFQPDYGKALELFRRLGKEFRKGETQWLDNAENRIREITQPSLVVSVPHVFLPDSEIEYRLNWRNVDEAKFTLYKVDLTKSVALKNGDTHSQSWLQGINKTALEEKKSWDWKPKPQRPHVPGNETIRMEEKLPIGAYLLVASGGGTESRELILVSDLSLVVHAAKTQVLVYACDSASGAPAANAVVELWERYHDGSWHWVSNEKEADAQGIALFEIKAGATHRELVALARSGEKQAFALNQNYSGRAATVPYKIYAATDRPAYRPGEKVNWKITARRPRGELYVVPSDETVTMVIRDPRGGELRREKIKLNNFGSGWGEFELGSDLALGTYRAVFVDEKMHEYGNAALFRLEEYKLPEFKVAVSTPKENGRPKTFLLGEKVEVEISADYYFGGPVANAAVEVVVRQAPFYHTWWEPNPYDWYFSERAERHRSPNQQAQEVQRESLKTDAEGKAKFTVQTPLSHGNDLEYRIEARVTDASRRGISASDSVRVTRQRFYVYPKPLRRIYQTQDKVEVEFKAMDANNQPVEAEGKVVVMRDYWYEVWLAPDGREVKGEELKKIKTAGVFPPPVVPGQPGWRLKFRGYEHDEIASRTLKTGTNGIATMSFTAEREGYYRLRWRSDENLQPGDGKIPGRPVRAETTVWVATSRSIDIGYRSGGLEILVDKEMVRAGEKVPVMLTNPSEDRYVLFTVTGNDLIDYQLVHMTGSVKLLEVAFDEKHVPNAFLDAAMVSDQQLFADRKDVVVPATKNFLTVDVRADREEYQPGENGTLRITTRSEDGKPVSAEVALGVVDESVYYIQEDLAGDPRPLFFGNKRRIGLNTTTSFYHRSYAKLLPRSQDEGLALGRGEEFFYDSLSENRTNGPRDTKLMRYSAGRADTRGRSQFGADVLAFTAAPAAPGALEKVSSTSLGGLADMEVAQAKEGAAVGSNEPNVQVRSDFRSTIFWKPDLRTAEDGTAEVSFKYPDSLTTWKATARAVTTGNQFGIGDGKTRTKQPLIVRLQAPRFFLVGDSVTVSAVVNNNTDEEVSVTPILEGVGIELPKMEAGRLKVAAGGEARTDWIIHPRKAGEVKLKVTARGAKHSDAMERAFTTYEHGIEKFLATAGKSRNDEVLATLNLPAERKEGSTRFTVQVAPSLAVTMLDALPYLVNYPYGCTEQTMSRFLPAAITANTLKNVGLKPEDILGRVFGGIEQARGNADAGKNLEKLNDVTEKGLQRLYDFQHEDGGWGWWKEGESDPFMSAYVVWGMTLAQDAGIELKKESLEKGAAYLDSHLVEAEQSFDLQAWMLHALATKAASDKRKISEFETKAFENLWQNRGVLNAYTRALFALAAHHFGKTDQARTLARNLENGVKVDNAPASSVLTPGRPAGRNDSTMATAHWGSDGVQWRWSDGSVETTAFALRALLAIDPRNELVDQVASWLIKNRRGAQWSNTRDTSIVLLALNDYLRVTREIEADLEYEVVVNGTSVGTGKVSGKGVFNAPNRFTVPESLLRGGDNQVRIVRKSGTSPIYFAVESSFFSLEEPIAPVGNEIFVKRQYFRLVPVPTLLNGSIYKKVEIRSGDEVMSGDRIETVLTIESKNNYEYLVFEDLKPAGVEAVDVRSGEPLFASRVRGASLLAAQGSPGIEPNINERDRLTGDGRWVYQELRDRKVALFLDKLPEGFWEIRYEARAEIPGRFHALPVVAHAMYVPEIRANSAETSIDIVEAAN